MQSSGLLEELLLANKSISTLFDILAEKNFEFYRVEILNRIASILVNGDVVDESERNVYTEMLLIVSDHLALRFKILQLLWVKNAIPSSPTIEFLSLDAQEADLKNFKLETPTVLETVSIDIDEPSSSSSVQPKESDPVPAQEPRADLQNYEEEINQIKKGDRMPLVFLKRISVISNEILSNKSSVDEQNESETADKPESLSLLSLLNSTDGARRLRPFAPELLSAKRTRSAVLKKKVDDDAFSELLSEDEPYSPDSSVYDPGEDCEGEDDTDSDSNFESRIEPSDQTIKGPEKTAAVPLQRLRDVRKKRLRSILPISPKEDVGSKQKKLYPIIRKNVGEEGEPKLITFADYIKIKHRSVRRPPTKDQSLPVSLIYGKTEMENTKESSRKIIKNFVRSPRKLSKLAARLVQECGGDPCAKGFDVEFIKLFNSKYPEYLVTVYDDVFDYKSIKYKTPKTQLNEKKSIDIFYDEEENYYYHLYRLRTFFGVNKRSSKRCSICGDFTTTGVDHKRCPKIVNEGKSLELAKKKKMFQRNWSLMKKRILLSEIQRDALFSESLNVETTVYSDDSDNDPQSNQMKSQNENNQDKKANSIERSKNPKPTKKKWSVILNRKEFNESSEEESDEERPPGTKKKYLTSRLSNGVRINLKQTTIEYIRSKKHSVIESPTKELSLPVALFFGKLINIEKKSKKKLSKVKSYKNNAEELLKDTQVLIKECAGHILPDTDFDFNFIVLFNSVYPEYLVTLYDKVNDSKSIMYKSPKTELNNENRINIFYDKEEKQYFCITRLPGFFNRRYQCKICDVISNWDHTLLLKGCKKK